jgi:hypothetical protein
MGNYVAEIIALFLGHFSVYDGIILPILLYPNF